MKDEIASLLSHELEEQEGKAPVESIGLDKVELLGKLRKLFETQPLAVLATQSETAPYVSLVAFASDEKLKYILFSTTKATRKYENLSANPVVSLLIDNRKNTIEDFRDAVAVTAMGKIEPVEDFERKIMENIYLMKHPHLVDFLHSPTNAFLKIHVEKYIVVTRFQHVVEVSV
ncbi:pyridoxamine 5'-phosphate oxidase family protein [Methanosarcina sp. KYL-1]|uniref:pyridoxamine 5'-phosphate oxidase family protein n=1 Tax=Methanosarcina sp. KYL-1 TaxID=2602068 RepID=UPI0021019916|nr:pyridoxamine 5'-phosphate oxidase family protein [Methanosarcina sp. KYL-1]MCQ1535214.1 pyridoxamine 5'-phosphate oxidase family protein [Methanosarcina sp. KYL-1]